MNRINIIDTHNHHPLKSILENTNQIKQKLKHGQIVILKHCFDTQRLLALKKAIQKWGELMDVFPPGKSASIPKINFHRIDKYDNKSKLPHIFHQYGFGDIEALERHFASALLTVAEPMMALQNSIANTHFSLSDSGIRLKVLHYPSGGGYLANHSHPLSPQRVGLILSLSEWDKDYREGGNVFSFNGNEKVYTSPHHHTGDILLFKYDIPHEIKPVDPKKSLNWQLLRGKWSVVLELLSTNIQSEVVKSWN